MNETRQLIQDTAQKIFQDLCTQEVVEQAEAGTFPDALWNALEESGLTLAAVPESLGGSGGDVSDAMEVLRQSGRFAVPLPLAETFVAGWLLKKAGAQVPERSAD